MKVLFFYGFESSLPSKKAQWLEEQGREVSALDINYACNSMVWVKPF